MAFDLVLQHIVQTETTNRSLKDSMFLISLYYLHNSIIWMYLCWKDAFWFVQLWHICTGKLWSNSAKEGEKIFFLVKNISMQYIYFLHSEEYNCNCKQKVFKRVYCLLSLKAMEKCRMISSILFLVFPK